MVEEARLAAELRDQIAAEKFAESERIKAIEAKQREEEREAADLAFKEHIAAISAEQAHAVELRRQEMERKDIERQELLEWQREEQRRITEEKRIVKEAQIAQAKLKEEQLILKARDEFERKDVAMQEKLA